MELHWVDQGGTVLQAREQNPRRHSGMNYDGVFRELPRRGPLGLGLAVGRVSGRALRHTAGASPWWGGGGQLHPLVS